MKAVKQKNGKWKATVYDYTDAQGKQHKKSFRADTKKQAELMALDYSNNKKPTNHSDMTLAEAYEKYFEVKSNVISPSTVRGYKTDAKNSFKTLHNIKINNITQEMVQAEVNQMAVGHSPKYVKNCHGLLSVVLRLFRPSFVLSTTLPPIIKKSEPLPSEAEIKLIMDNCKGTDIERAIFLGCFGGLRRSEICAITQENIKEDGITVDKALVYNDKKEWVIKGTKTPDSTRFLPLPPEMIAKLKEAKTDRIVNLTPNAVSSRFKRLCLKYTGKPYHIHLTRHFSATLYHSLGISDHWIMEHLGWSNTQTLHNIYVNSISEEEKRQNAIAFEKISSIFSDNSGEEFGEEKI